MGQSIKQRGLSHPPPPLHLLARTQLRIYSSRLMSEPWDDFDATDTMELTDPMDPMDPMEPMEGLDDPLTPRDSSSVKYLVETQHREVYNDEQGVLSAERVAMVDVENLEEYVQGFVDEMAAATDPVGDEAGWLGGSGASSGWRTFPPAGRVWQTPTRECQRGRWSESCA